MFFYINDTRQLCSAPPPSPAVVVIIYSDVPLRLIIISECDHPLTPYYYYYYDNTNLSTTTALSHCLLPSDEDQRC